MLLNEPIPVETGRYFLLVIFVTLKAKTALFSAIHTFRVFPLPPLNIFLRLFIIFANYIRSDAKLYVLRRSLIVLRAIRFAFGSGVKNVFQQSR